MLEREEVIPRYKFASLPYYRKEYEDEKLKEKNQNFEPQIHYLVEQEVATQSIKMSKGVELVLVAREEIIVLPKVEPTVAKGVLVAIKVGYTEPVLINHT
jgi:hypothetical protein